MIVAVVSFDDQETSRQTPQTAKLVAAVPVRLTHPVRGNINSIASTNRILSPPQGVGNSRSLNFSHGVSANFAINAKRHHNNGRAKD